MGADRKTAEVRERELRMALSRIQRGRSRTKPARLSIAAVAREAAVTPALIHNHYPDMAATIRQAMGRGERARREAKDQELKAARARSRELRDEVAALRVDVARLASINEVLIAENATLKSGQGRSAAVVSLPVKPPSHRHRS